VLFAPTEDDTSTVAIWRQVRGVDCTSKQLQRDTDKNVLAFLVRPLKLHGS